MIGSVSFYLSDNFTILFIVSIAINFIANASDLIGYIIMSLCGLLIIVLGVVLIKYSET